MMLTPITLPDLPAALRAFAQAVADDPLCAAAFGRIAASLEQVEGEALTLSQDPGHHAQGVALLADFGMEVHDAPPPDALTWDGRAAWVRMEPSVLIHEVGHLQTCAPERRAVPDFGLGAGPETGDHVRALADAAMTVTGVEREMEEALASLQGILWEAELGQPAILAFLEQNWLEGGASATNITHFRKILHALHGAGLVDDQGHPTRRLRESNDATFLGPLVTPA